MNHIVPVDENKRMPETPTFFQRYIGPSLIALAITGATLIFGFGGSTERLNYLDSEIKEIKEEKKDFATKDDVRRVEEAVKDMQKDVKDLIKQQKR